MTNLCDWAGAAGCLAAAWDIPVLEVGIETNAAYALGRIVAQIFGRLGDLSVFTERRGIQEQRCNFEGTGRPPDHR